MIVRPIGPDDEDAYRAILEQTTAEDRYCRFFHHVDHFDAEEVQRFVETRDDMVGVIAFDGEVPLGAAHAALLADGEAELGIVVAQGARHHGVGRAMADALVALLGERGYRRLTAVSLRENHAFAHLAKELGLVVESAEGDALRWGLDLDAQAARKEHSVAE